MGNLFYHCMSNCIIMNNNEIITKNEHELNLETIEYLNIQYNLCYDIIERYKIMEKLQILAKKINNYFKLNNSKKRIKLYFT
jgi:hypothetical protein